MPSRDTIVFAETISVLFTVFGFTYAFDGLIRRHVVSKNMLVGRIELKGWAAAAVGIFALLILTSTLYLSFGVWRDVAIACSLSPTCMINAAVSALWANVPVLFVPLIAVGWLWIWLVRGPEGYTRR